MKIVAGIDGCHEGWLCLVKDLISNEVSLHILTNISGLLSLEPKPDVITVDIPIGLPDLGSRDCDTLARSHLLQPRACSVFPAPIRPVLIATTWDQACKIGRKAEERALSQQTWAILPKIKEVDSFLRDNPSFQSIVWEVHPEISFWVWNNKKAMITRKRLQEGRRERETLVSSLYNGAYQKLQERPAQGQYRNDDLLDAFSALYTAERFAKKSCLFIPENPIKDIHGLRMQIIA